MQLRTTCRHFIAAAAIAAASIVATPVLAQHAPPAAVTFKLTTADQATPEATIRAYFRAMDAKDWEAIQALCPDINIEQTKLYAGSHRTTGSAEVSPAEPKKAEDGWQFHAVRVPYGTYTFTPKLALRQQQDGRWVISEKHSIWMPDNAPGAETMKQREEAHKKALEAGAKEIATWPKTPEALLRDFWNAASKKDYDRMQVLCPGSLKKDFATHYDRFTPSPAKSVGDAQPHPLNASIKLYPVTVSFPGFPEKTIKMAVDTLPDGRLVVDGQNTIWW